MILQKAETSEGNYRYLTDKFKMINRYLGDVEVQNIDVYVIAEFTEKQKTRNPNISISTLNKYRELIVRVLKHICKIEITVKKLKENRKTFQTVPKDVINKIFKYYNDHLEDKQKVKYYLLLRLLLNTGMRINELLHVKVKDVDFKLNTIHVRITKTKQERWVFYDNQTSILLQSYVYKYLIKGYIFQNKNGNPMQYKSMMKNLTRLRRTLRIDCSISPHKWRHTFATNYIMNGGDTATLQKLLGHNNLSTTERYLHLNLDLLRKRYLETMNKD